MAVRFNIQYVSAANVLGMAKHDKDKNDYFFNLDYFQTKHVLLSTEPSSASILFRQICLEKDNSVWNRIRENPSQYRDYLKEDIVFVDFQDVPFTENSKNDTLDIKIVKAFLKNGFSLTYTDNEDDKGTHYSCFDRSSSMSKDKKVSFIKTNLLENIDKRVSMGLCPKEVNLSKYLAYRGLALTSGTSIDDDELVLNSKNVIVINDVLRDSYVSPDGRIYITTVNRKKGLYGIFAFENNMTVIGNDLTISDKNEQQTVYTLKTDPASKNLVISEINDKTHRFTLKKDKDKFPSELFIHREENCIIISDKKPSEKNSSENDKKEYFKKITTNYFDGEGICSPHIAQILRKNLNCSEDVFRPSSFQIRLPYIKGVIHELDFKAFFQETLNLDNLNDIFLTDFRGVKHCLNDIDVILTVSQLKCAPWIASYKNRFDFLLDLNKADINKLFDAATVLNNSNTDDLDHKKEFISLLAQLNDECTPEEYQSIQEEFNRIVDSEISKDDKKRLVEEILESFPNTYNYYWKCFELYKHTMFIANVGREPTEIRSTNYQIMSTVPLEKNEFNSISAPLKNIYKAYKGIVEDNVDNKENQAKVNALKILLQGETNYAFSHLQNNQSADEIQSESDENEDENSLSEETDIYKLEENYYDKSTRIKTKSIILNNDLIFTKYGRELLKTGAKKSLSQYGKARFLIQGYNLFASGDLLYFLSCLKLEQIDKQGNVKKTLRYIIDSGNELKKGSFYAPCFNKEYNNKPCVLTRNPHMTVNELVRRKCFVPAEESIRHRYCSHLKSVCFVDGPLTNDFLAGMDYDGDRILIITNNSYVDAVGLYPFAIIEHEKADKNVNHQNPKSIDALYNTYALSFGNSVGLLSNIAFRELVLKYNKNDPENLSLDVNSPEILKFTRIINNEIDSNKNSVHPPEVSQYKNKSNGPETDPFLLLKKKINKKAGSAEIRESVKKCLESNIKKNKLKEDQLPNLYNLTQEYIDLSKSKSSFSKEETPVFIDEKGTESYSKVAELFEAYTDRRMRFIRSKYRKKNFISPDEKIEKLIFTRNEYDCVSNLFVQRLRVFLKSAYENDPEKFNEVKEFFRSAEWLFSNPDSRLEIIQKKLSILSDSDLIKKEHRFLCDFSNQGELFMNALFESISPPTSESVHTPTLSEDEEEDNESVFDETVELEDSNDYKKVFEGIQTNTTAEDFYRELDKSLLDCAKGIYKNADNETYIEELYKDYKAYYCAGNDQSCFLLFEVFSAQFLNELWQEKNKKEPTKMINELAEYTYYKDMLNDEDERKKFFNCISYTKDKSLFIYVERLYIVLLRGYLFKENSNPWKGKSLDEDKLNEAVKKLRDYAADFAKKVCTMENDKVKVYWDKKLNLASTDNKSFYISANTVEEIIKLDSGSGIFCSDDGFEINNLALQILNPVFTDYKNLNYNPASYRFVLSKIVVEAVNAGKLESGDCVFINSALFSEARENTKKSKAVCLAIYQQFLSKKYPDTLFLNFNSKAFMSFYGNVIENNPGNYLGKSDFNILSDYNLAKVSKGNEYFGQVIIPDKKYAEVDEKKDIPEGFVCLKIPGVFFSEYMKENPEYKPMTE